MKIYIIFTLILSIFLSYVVVQSVLHNNESNVAAELIKNLESSGCSTSPSREDAFLRAKSSSIRKLGEFERKCNSEVTSHLLYEIIIPENAGAANLLANNTASMLLEFSEYGITPVVMVRPSESWNAQNFDDLKSGKYDEYLHLYFQQLQSLNIDGNKIGYWILFPEANLPYWGGQNINPDDFGTFFNNYASIMNNYYPQSQLGILLNSSTYENKPVNWTDKEYNSLLPYTKNVSPDYVSFVGIQGLPWIPPVNLKAENILNPSEYINTRLAEELANALNTKTIWIQTGTFSVKYANQNESIAIFPPDMRKKLLSESLSEVKKLQLKGFDVKVSLLSIDKTLADDYTDWSYWGNMYTENPGHENAVLDFLREVSDAEIDVALFLK